MRIETYAGGIEQQALSYLYLTDNEISEYGLEPTNYESRIYDWIKLPNRDDFAEPGEHLVAAYGGKLSDLCCLQTEFNDSNEAKVTFYSLPGWDESKGEEDLDYLPKDLRDKLCNAIKERYGTYSKDDFKEPFFYHTKGEWREKEPISHGLAQNAELQFEFARKATEEKETKIITRSDPQNILAEKAGYVQGVCECIAAISNDLQEKINHILGKNLLTEMGVTKDMAKKFANPETYKTLEKGIFAQKPEQKLERTHNHKR